VEPSVLGDLEQVAERDAARGGVHGSIMAFRGAGNKRAHLV
jgi:hypothetical protein